MSDNEFDDDAKIEGENISKQEQTIVLIIILNELYAINPIILRNLLKIMLMGEDIGK